METLFLCGTYFQFMVVFIVQTSIAKAFVQGFFATCDLSSTSWPANAFAVALGNANRIERRQTWL
jgi:hypothetical protein